MHYSQPSRVNQTARRLLRAVVACSLAGVIGCANEDRKAASPDRASLASSSSVLRLVPGRTAVIPVRIDGSFDSKRGFTVVFDAGTHADASLVWLSVDATDPLKTTPELPVVERATSIACRASSWMELSIGGNRAFWSATPADRAVKPGSTGTWAVVLRTPATFAEPERPVTIERTQRRTDDDGARPATIQLGSQHLMIAWIEDTSKLESAWSPPPLISEAAMQSPWLRGTLDILSHTPQQRWRVRLVIGEPFGYSSAAPAASETSSRPDAAHTPTDMFLDPALEALATHIELQWRAALNKLASENEATALAVAKRLCQVVDFGSGIFMPAWESDAGSVAELFEFLMVSGTAPGSISDRAQHWLELRPDFAVCVTDDAGSEDQLTSGAISTMLVANLTSVPAASWAPTPSTNISLEIAAVEPYSTKQLRAVSSSPSTQTRRDDGAVVVRSGVQTARDGLVIPIRAGGLDLRRRVSPWRVPVFPPGCTVGPLRPDWTMRGWLRVASSTDDRVDPGPWALREAVDAAWATAGMIYLGSPSDIPASMQSAGGGGGSPQWIMYLECLRVPPSPSSPGTGPMDSGASMRPSGFVRVWLGPSHSPLAVYKVMPDGSILDESPGGSRQGPPLTSNGGVVSARVATEATRWSCWVPLPKSAIERDGTLRIGMERVDDRGVRSAWPRPMFPWQYEPGRAAIDTRGWTKISP